MQLVTATPRQPMRVSKVLIKSIRRFESFRSKAYQDTKGVWTIGYGHTLNVKEGDSITRKEAEKMLQDDLKEYESYVDSLDICQNDQCHFDALTDFAYNCGIENLRTSNLLQIIRQGREESEIREEFMKWIYSGKRKLRGLALRRKWEADRYFGRSTPISLWEKVTFALAGKINIPISF